MPNDKATKAALAVGRKQAKQVLDFRNQARQARQQLLEGMAAPADVGPGAAAAPAAELAALGAGQVLVAEGDSWFDYPWTDVLRILEDTYLYTVESVSHRGDRIEAMAYGGGQLEELTRRLERLFQRNTVPDAILLSGGGNDVAGAEFGMLINHANSATPGLNELVVQGVIDERIRLAYITLLSAISHVCAQSGHPGIPILVHGYDYPVPDGRGFLGGWGFLPGPWLEPGFREKGYLQLARKKQIAKLLIDRFNAMLAGVAAMPEFAHVQYVDLRNTLSTGADYRLWWDNELHPTARGFDRVVEKLRASL
jgi:lysophospholipase L1-like esterase